MFSCQIPLLLVELAFRKRAAQNKRFWRIMCQNLLLCGLVQDMDFYTLRFLTSATVRAAREASAASPIHGATSATLFTGTTMPPMG